MKLLRPSSPQTALIISGVLIGLNTYPVRAEVCLDPTDSGRVVCDGPGRSALTRPVPLPDWAFLTVDLDTTKRLIVLHNGRSYRITPELLERLK